MNSKFYHGISKDSWDELCYMAEDLLREKNLGTHIVGIYPVKGKRSNQACILCLYIDSVDSLLDPTTLIKDRTITLLPDNRIIYMQNLFTWVYTVTRKSFHEIRTDEIAVSIIEAPFGDILYENQSIADILYNAKQYLDGKAQAKEVGEQVVELYRSLI